MSKQLKIGLPPLQPEDYLAILRRICIVNWCAVAVAVLLQLLIRGSGDYEWPQWGNFSWTYNLVLLEFTGITVMLTVLLSKRAWLEKAPRDAMDNLRHLLLAIMILDGLHFLGFFHLTGSLQGPMMIVLPVALLTTYLMLPRSDSNLVTGVFLIALGLLLAAQAYGFIESRGLLGDAFDLSKGHIVPFGFIAGTAVLASVWIGNAAADKMDAAGISLQRNAMFDPVTKLFTRDVLERRIPGELTRVDRRKSTASLMLIEINDFDEVNTQWGYKAGTQVIHQLAAGLQGVTRTGGDTCALFGPTTFAALLPTASANASSKVAERMVEYAAKITVASEGSGGAQLAIGIATTTNANGANANAFMTAAEDALHEALSQPGTSIVFREV